MERKYMTENKDLNDVEKIIDWIRSWEDMN